MPEHIQTVRVRDLRCEAEGVVSVELEASLSGHALPSWQPGAHIDLKLPNGLVRQYSLCGDPASSQWRIAVLHEPGRGGSTYIHQELRAGALLDVVGPRNHFELEDADAYVFIAGGIGITPILPMVRQCDRDGKAWTLVYGGRRRASMAFVDELGRYDDLVQIVPEDECGRIDIRGALTDAPGRPAVYSCGPTGLLNAVTGEAAKLGMECHIERFTPVISPDQARLGNAFDVVLRRTGLTLTVQDGESILDVVEEAGVAVTSSCREGTCGSCETPVISGAIDHRDGILTEEERNEGLTMMICVSRARGATLELDM